MASKGGLPQRELLIYWISARSTAKSQGKEECKLVPYVKAVHLFSRHRSSPICDISFKGTLCTKGYVLPPCVGLKKRISVFWLSRGVQKPFLACFDTLGPREGTNKACGVSDNYVVSMFVKILVVSEI